MQIELYAEEKVRMESEAEIVDVVVDEDGNFVIHHIDYKITNDMQP